MSDTAPVMDLVGGPQGSGKSSVFPVADRGHDAFNVDAHRRALNGGVSQNIPAAIREQATRDYTAFIEDHIAQRRSFSIEVTLAKEIRFEQAERARRAGFLVRLTFVATALEECLRRVASRVQLGGHGVTAAVLKDTYAASMHNLPRALAAFDLVQVYDNSLPASPTQSQSSTAPLVLETLHGRTTVASESPPVWLRNALRGSAYAQ
ncbi:MAG: hypothetical protein FD180_3067 [Planctomycetota bacterium]|nr:MAG: hypothetical protein FD180_3067 [Planctomycetota bacterium]